MSAAGTPAQSLLSTFLGDALTILSSDVVQNPSTGPKTRMPGPSYRGMSTVRPVSAWKLVSLLRRAGTRSPSASLRADGGDLLQFDMSARTLQRWMFGRRGSSGRRPSGARRKQFTADCLGKLRQQWHSRRSRCADVWPAFPFLNRQLRLQSQKGGIAWHLVA